MGDRGGKKDKEKNRQHLAKKQKQEKQRKQNRIPPTTTVLRNPTLPSLSSVIGGVDAFGRQAL